jgi:hypothetical protein
MKEGPDQLARITEIPLPQAQKSLKSPRRFIGIPDFLVG